MDNYEGTIKREKMLSVFSSMIRPARLITNFSQEELAKKSGLPVELIAGVENGIHRFHEPHYLALAAVFDNTKYTENYNIYRAVLRILTPEDEDINANDFVLIRRWFDTFEKENDFDNLLENLAENYEIYTDISAVEDENFPAFVSRLEPMLRQVDAKIFVPSTVINELDEDIEISENEREKLDLIEARNYVKNKSLEGVIEIHECPDDFDDTREVFTAMLNGAQGYKRIAIITQDFELANDLMSGQKNFLAASINDTGDVVIWGADKNE